MVRACYLAMELVGWYALVPLAFASLLTGLVQSLGTKWGLFRHYWILAKPLMTIPATIGLLVHTRQTSFVADVARETAWSRADLGEPRIALVRFAGGGLLVLLVATTLAVYKPWGMTRYGRRKVSRP